VDRTREPAMDVIAGTLTIYSLLTQAQVVQQPPLHLGHVHDLQNFRSRHLVRVFSTAVLGERERGKVVIKCRRPLPSLQDGDPVRQGKRMVVIVGPVGHFPQHVGDVLERLPMSDLAKHQAPHLQCKAKRDTLS